MLLYMSHYVQTQIISSLHVDKITFKTRWGLYNICPSNLFSLLQFTKYFTNVGDGDNSV
jgi:hypothetical protein